MRAAVPDLFEVLAIVIQMTSMSLVELLLLFSRHRYQARGVVHTTGTHGLRVPS